MKYIKYLLLLGLLSLFFIPKIYAGYPNSFSNGTLTDATLVNANNDYFENKFSTSSGHVHNGTDSKKIDLTTYSWTGNVIATAYGGTHKDNSSATQGSVMYVDATGDIVALAPSTSGYYLKTQGVGANPAFGAGSDMNYSDTRYKVGSFVRATGNGNADVAYTGTGFTPKVIIFFTTGPYGQSVGMDDDSTHLTNWTQGTTPAYAASSTQSIVQTDGTNAEQGKIKTFDSNGFTITWAALNSPTGDMQVNYIAYR